jgi:hypothetical protein
MLASISSGGNQGQVIWARRIPTGTASRRSGPHRVAAWRETYGRHFINRMQAGLGMETGGPTEANLPV